jgi:aminoglycoside 6'-N-acetyltransferase
VVPEPAPVLRGKRVTLRPLEPADVPRLAAILQEPEIALWWGDHDAKRVRRDLLDDPETIAFAIETEGGLIGVVMYSEENDPDYRHAGIDIALTAARHGRGLGAETLRVLARYLFEVRGHHRLTIDPAAGNERAIRCYESVGFRRVGVLRQYERGADGTWHDGLLMDLLATELEERILPGELP